MIDHPLKKVPGTGRATWDSWMGRWVVLPHHVVRLGAMDDYRVKPHVPKDVWADLSERAGTKKGPKKDDQVQGRPRKKVGRKADA